MISATQCSLIEPMLKFNRGNNELIKINFPIFRCFSRTPHTVSPHGATLSHVIIAEFRRVLADRHTIVQRKDYFITKAPQLHLRRWSCSAYSPILSHFSPAKCEVFSLLDALAFIVAEQLDRCRRARRTCGVKKKEQKRKTEKSL